jgi:hypothetical protein
MSYACHGFVRGTQEGRKGSQENFLPRGKSLFRRIEYIDCIRNNTRNELDGKGKWEIINSKEPVCRSAFPRA